MLRNLLLILWLLLMSMYIFSACRDKPDPCEEGIDSGEHVFQLKHDGVERAYTVYIPEALDVTTPAPLVLNFHGYLSNMEEQIVFSDMNATADTGGFVVAYPNGLADEDTGETSWNAGNCCSFGDERDDIGFVRALVAEIRENVCIDEKRIYSTGFSNGGFMSYYLACHAADLIAAIAPVAGVLGIPGEECTPSRHVPLIHFHGTADRIVPYDGGGPLPSMSVADTINVWTELNDCTDPPVETYNNGDAYCETYESCTDDIPVTLCTIAGLDHCWPGQSDCSVFGPPTSDISANDEMWNFFQQFSLP